MLNEKIKLWLKVSAIVAISAASFALPAYANAADKEKDDNATTRSLTGDWLNPVFHVDLNDGASTFDTNVEKSKRENINNEIIEGKASKNYSLYDRFGGQAKFIPYFGEKTFDLNLVDTFYQNYRENNDEFKFKIEDLWSDRSASVQTQAYPKRAKVLSEADVKNNKKDPRVDAYGIADGVGGSASVGNFYLGIGNFTIDIYRFLNGDTIRSSINGFWGEMEKSGIWKNIARIVTTLLPMFVLGFVFYILRIAPKVSKNGEFKRAFMVILNFFFSMGFVYMLLAEPAALNGLVNTAVKAGDDLFSSAINETIAPKEIAKSDDITNVEAATLWNKVVLQPWSQGMFGKNYNQMYSNYAKLSSGEEAYPMSNDNIKGDFKGVRYNATNLVGDISVPLGKSEAKNFAALAYSTGSIYHVDAVKDEEENKDDNSKKNYAEMSWPKATVTPKNDQIYIDDFRWLDAKLNVSPQYQSGEKETDDYDKSNDYSYNFKSNGVKSAWFGLLLLPICVPLILRLKALLVALLSGLRGIGYGLMAMFYPDRYENTIGQTLKKLSVPVGRYYYWSLIKYIMVIMYVILIDKGWMGYIIWLAVCVVSLTYDKRELYGRTARFRNHVKNKSLSAWSDIKQLASKVK